MAPFKMLSMPLFEKVNTLMEKAMVCPYVKSSIMSQSIHDLKGSSLHCRCGGY